MKRNIYSSSSVNLPGRCSDSLNSLSSTSHFCAVSYKTRLRSLRYRNMWQKSGLFTLQRVTERMPCRINVLGYTDLSVAGVFIPQHATPRLSAHWIKLLKDSKFPLKSKDPRVYGYIHALYIDLSRERLELT